MNMNPCKGCLERHTACWDKCEKYLKAKRENELIRKRRAIYSDSSRQYIQRLTDSKLKGRR